MKKLQLSLSVFAIVAVFTAGGLIHAGDLDQIQAPKPTMKTLNEIPPTWSQKLSGSERFVLVLDDEAVLDKETGLVWEQSPDTAQVDFWFAYSGCYGRYVGGRMGWRLPTFEELASLVDRTQSNPALPSGHPFSGNVMSSPYWSASTLPWDFGEGYLVNFADGQLNTAVRSVNHYVWCVRCASGYDVTHEAP